MNLNLGSVKSSFTKSQKYVSAFNKANGTNVTSILQTCPPSLKEIKPSELKLTSLKTDAVTIHKKEYNDVVKNMIAQRKQTVLDDNACSLDKILQNYKDNYIPANREIRWKIMDDLGVEDVFPSQKYLDFATKEVDSIVSQNFIPRDIVLYRGAGSYDFGLSLSPKDFIDKYYKKGRLFKIPIYPETSLDKSVAKSFAEENILFKINTPKGTNGIYMENLGLEKTGSYGNEEEILLARDLIYKFKSYVQENGQDIIELDIVKKKPFWKKIHEFWKET